MQEQTEMSKPESEKEFRIRIRGANLFARTKVLTLIKRASEVFNFKYVVEDIG